MYLSMHMIRWYLREHSQIVSIRNDRMSIRGLRFLSGNMPDMHQDYMYLGNAYDYFSDKQYRKAYIVVHQKNYILFPDAEFEDLLNGLLSAFDYFGSWERRMFMAANPGMSLQEITDLSHEVLCNPITVVDLEGNIVALNSSDVPADDLYWQYKVAEGQEHPDIFSQQWFSPEGTPIHELSHTPQLVRNVQQGQAPLIMMYLFQDEEPVALFYILVVNQDLLDMDMQLSGEICKHLTFSQEFCQRNVQLRSSEKLMRDFLDQQLCEGAEGESAAAKLQNMAGAGKWRLALLRHISRKDRLYTKSMLRILKSTIKTPCTFYKDEILFLLSETRRQEILDYLENQNPSGHILLALSMPASDYYSLPLRFAQTTFTAEQAMNSPGIHKCEDYAFAYIREQVANVLTVSGLRHPALSVLEEYDRENHTSLRETLTVFLQNHCSILETANKMYVHRNTVKYRIARIQDITGLSFDNTEDLKYLCVSDWVL